MMEQNTTTEVKWGEWIGGGWQMFTERWQVWVPMILVFILALLVPIIPAYLISVAAVLAGSRGGDLPTGPPLLAIGVGLIGGLVVLGLTTFMLGGIYRTAFKQMRGEAISIRDLFSGGDLLPRFLAFFAVAFGGALAIYFLVFAIGYLLPLALLLVVPVFFVLGLLAAGALFFAIPLMVEKNMGVIEAIQTSFAKTRPRIWMFGLFAIVVALIGAVGQCACYVGMLVTYPLQFLITAVAYRDVFGVAGARGMAAPASYASPSWQQGGQPSYMPPPPQFTPPQTPQSYAPSQMPQSYTPQQPPQAYAPPPPDVRDILPPTAVMPSSIAPSEDQNICPHCKALLARTARFCNYCGKPLP